MNEIKVVPKIGKYICNFDQDVSDQSFHYGIIDVLHPETLRVSETPVQPVITTRGSLIKTNLIRASAGWKWHENPQNIQTDTLCSLSNSKNHCYSLKIIFENGITLSRYPEAKTEPRLRPSCYGQLLFGEQIGKIILQGRFRDVFDEIRITK
jgi:hypothetical protein